MRNTHDNSSDHSSNASRVKIDRWTLEPSLVRDGDSPDVPDSPCQGRISDDASSVGPAPKLLRTHPTKVYPGSPLCQMRRRRIREDSPDGRKSPIISADTGQIHGFFPRGDEATGLLQNGRSTYWSRAWRITCISTWRSSRTIVRSSASPTLWLSRTRYRSLEFRTGLPSAPTITSPTTIRRRLSW